MIVINIAARFGSRTTLQDANLPRSSRVLRGTAVSFSMDESDQRQMVVLCVDDEPLGLTVRKLLLESEGYRVFTADNGPAALGLLSSERIDVVVLDYSMPGMNGAEVAERIKHLHRHLPVIMLSAYVDLPSDALAYADKSIVKGDPPEVLLETIAQLLDQNESIASASG